MGMLYLESVFWIWVMVGGLFVLWIVVRESAREEVGRGWQREFEWQRAGGCLYGDVVRMRQAREVRMSARHLTVVSSKVRAGDREWMQSEGMGNIGASRDYSPYTLLELFGE